MKLTFFVYHLWFWPVFVEINRYTRPGFSVCVKPDSTQLLGLLNSRFPNVNFGQIATFKPEDWTKHIQVLIGTAPDLESTDPHFVWPTSLHKLDFYLPSLDFNNELLGMLQKQFPNITFLPFDPSRFLPQIEELFGFSPADATSKVVAFDRGLLSKDPFTQFNLRSLKKVFGVVPTFQQLVTYILSRIEGFEKKFAFGPLAFQAGYDDGDKKIYANLSLQLKLEGDPAEVLASATQTFKNMLNMIPNDNTLITKLIDNPPNTNLTGLANLQKYPSRL
jgi:hypothetical protein